MQTKFEVLGYELLEKVVAMDKADSGRIYVPKSWKGKRVVVVRLDDFLGSGVAETKKASSFDLI
jgi:hypothetical protein